MSEPYLGQIMMSAFSYAPKGFARADGALLPINQNQVLFSLLGTSFGGDGVTTFALPDLRGRSPLHVGSSGSSYALGQRIGVESHALTAAEIPQHVHHWPGTSAAPAPRITPDAQAAFATSPIAPYRDGGTLIDSGASTGATGNSQPHSNRQPYLVVNFFIALQGLYPSWS